MREFLDKIGIKTSSNKVDYIFLFVIIILLSIGLLALSSASSYTALVNQGNSNYYFVRQLIFAIVGVAAMLFVSLVDCKNYEKFGYIIYAIALGIMLLVFVPGLGQSVNGARRWLNLGILSFQPSELMKPALAIGIATYISKNITKMNNWQGYIIPVFMIAIVCVVMYFSQAESATPANVKNLGFFSNIINKLFFSSLCSMRKMTVSFKNMDNRNLWNSSSSAVPNP